PCVLCCLCNRPAITEIYTLSLHDALPISATPRAEWSGCGGGALPGTGSRRSGCSCRTRRRRGCSGSASGRRWEWRNRGLRRKPRSEEHTSELQSRENLVCRLLLEKKKNQK